MIHSDLQQTHHILVAASIAKDSGFSETEAALRKIARCAVCANASNCSGVVCVFRPGAIDLLQEQ